MSLTPSRRETIINALSEAADYFNGRADVTADGDSPNREMELQQLCEEALECFDREEVKYRAELPPEYEHEDRYEAQFLPPRPRDDIPL